VRFQALSIGVEVTSNPFSGTVHSVFRQACNVSLEPGTLLTLLPCQKSNVPHGIRLDTSSHFDFLHTLRVGQSATCRGGILRIDGADCSVDLRLARPWHIDLKGLHIDLCRPTQAQSWVVAWSELNRHYHKDGLSDHLGVFSQSRKRPATSVVSEILLQQSAHTIPSLLEATCRLRLREAMLSVRTLIGLGYGLTPSGDDFLVGYLAGLWCTAGANLSRMQFLMALGSELSQVSQHTNEISCAYLRSAAKGHVSEPIAKLAQRLSQANNMSSIRAATHAALQVGHTSGSDGVLGLLLGCLAWQGLPPHLIFSDLLRLSVLHDSTAQP
jgi:Protein of unknown function (DUF2877)